MHTTDVNMGIRLDVRSLSFVQTFSKGSWLSNIYMPPISAQFLSNISFQVFRGEVHGIIGAAGCGKSTLLQVLANRVQGSVTGEVILNGQDLTDENFSRLCEFVNFEMKPMDFLTVEQSIRFHTQLALNCNADAVAHRTLNLMQQFDLMPYAQTFVVNLTRSALKRLILVLHLVKDPVLILVDDPLSDIDALSSYQMVSALKDHVKRNSRMAIITMKFPRSDIYQLLAQLTLLFYGEVVYSGPTKFMPHYFGQIGYRCPISENPAVYYLSLATVDRETPESYGETQSKAANLVDVFNVCFVYCRDKFDCRKDERLSISRPITITNTETYLTRLFCLVTLGLLSVLAYVYPCLLMHIGPVYSSVHGSISWIVWLSILLQWEIFSTIIGWNYIRINLLHSPIFHLLHVKNVRQTMFWEVSENLYNSCLMLVSFLFASMIFDVFSISLSSISFIWIVYPAFTTHNLLALVLAMSCTYFFYKLLVLMLFMIIADVHRLVLVAVMVCCISTTFSSGFLKSYQSFNPSNEWIFYLTSASPERFSNLILFNEFINKTRIPSCRRNEQQAFTRLEDFCRWKTGSEFLAEILLDPNSPPEYWQSILIITISVLITVIPFVLITKRRAQALCSK